MTEAEQKAFDAGEESAWSKQQEWSLRQWAFDRVSRDPLLNDLQQRTSSAAELVAWVKGEGHGGQKSADA